MSAYKHSFVLTVALISALCGRAAVAGGGGPVGVVQFRVRAVVAAGTLASQLALQALDHTVLFLQLFRQPGRRKRGISLVYILVCLPEGPPRA